MHSTFLTFLAYALITFAAPTTISSTPVAVSTDSNVLSVTQTTGIPTASLTAVAPIPSSSSLVPSGYPSSAQNDGDGWDGAQGENEDEPDEDEKEPDADENEPAESENGEDDDDGEDSKDSEGANNSKQWSQEKFRFEVEIDANTAHPFLHSILPKDGDDLDISVELDASRDSYLLRQLLSELGGAIHDAADIVGEGASGGSGDFIDGSAQNGTLTTQTTRRASTSGDSSGKPGGKVILRVRSHLQSKDDAK